MPNPSPRPRSRAAAATDPQTPAPESPAPELEREVPAPNVVVALSRVMRDLPAIGKDGRAPDTQGGYAYRGIEQITREAQTILARHGVVFVPHDIRDRERIEIVVAGKPWTDERFTVHYRAYGPGGADDFIDVVVPGIGRDNSDKGSNKAMTQAFKYALIQTLCISDSNDDADGATHEADAGTTSRRQSAPAEPETISPGDVLRIRTAIERAENTDEITAGWQAQKFGRLDALPAPRVKVAIAWLASQGVVVAEAEEGEPDVVDRQHGSDGGADVDPVAVSRGGAVDQGAMLGCPHCAAEIGPENKVVTWDDPTWDASAAAEGEKAPVIAGCESCQPM